MANYEGSKPAFFIIKNLPPGMTTEQIRELVHDAQIEAAAQYGMTRYEWDHLYWRAQGNGNALDADESTLYTKIIHLMAKIINGDDSNRDEQEILF